MGADELIRLLVDVKPSLEGQAIEDTDRLMDDLGLDSLDLVQLARKIRKATGVPFDLEAFAAEERARATKPSFTFGNLLRRLGARP